jgi:hypothetical protein
MTPKTAAFLLVLLASFSFFAYSVRKLILLLKIGKSDNRFDKPFLRLKRMVVIALGQSKLFREIVPGLMHAIIFWGFVVLLLAVVEAIGEGLFPGFSWVILGPLYKPLIVVQDFFVACVTLSVLFAMYRRFVIRPKRLEVDRHGKIDATFILVLILFIMATMTGQNAASMALTGTTHARFLSAMFVPLFSGASATSTQTSFDIFWWAHVLLVLGFLNYLPYSKHLHVLTSIPNVYFSSIQPKGAIRPLNLEEEGVERFGVADVEDLTWKQLLDGYTCTECGRCTASCPANLTGKLLSPRKIVVDIRKRLSEKGPLLLEGKKAAEAV